MNKTEKIEAFEVIYQKYNRLVRSILYYNLQSAEAYDLTQEVFIKVWKNLSHLKKLDQLKPWIVKVTRNTLYDYYRKNKINEIDAIKNSEEEPSLEELKNYTQQDTVVYLLKKLSPQHRELVSLHFLLDMSLIEISEALNVKLGTLKSRLHYAKKELMKECHRIGGCLD